MGKLIMSTIASLDGYVADRDGDFRWAEPDEEVLAAINEEEREVGTYLYGRRTYEMMTVWETDPSMAEYTPQSGVYTEIWKAADKVVYSTTLPEATTRRTRLERRMDREEVRALKEASPSSLTVSGPTLAATAFELGLVDEVRLLLCPVSIGSGLAALPDRRIDLRLRHERRFSGGMVQLRYDVIAPERAGTVTTGS